MPDKEYGIMNPTAYTRPGDPMHPIIAKNYIWTFLFRQGWDWNSKVLEVRIEGTRLIAEINLIT